MENPSGRLGRSAPAQPQPRRGPKSLAGDLKVRGLPVLGWARGVGSLPYTANAHCLQTPSIPFTYLLKLISNLPESSPAGLA